MVSPKVQTMVMAKWFTPTVMSTKDSTRMGNAQVQACVNLALLALFTKVSGVTIDLKAMGSCSLCQMKL